MKSLISLVLSAALVASGCDGSDDAPRPRVGVLDSTAPAPPPSRLTPAESAAAVAGVRAHVDSTRAEAQRRAGLTPEAAPAAANTPPPILESYASCMEKARAAESPLRERLEQACANRRDAAHDDG